MKIKKYIWDNGEYHYYYKDSKTDNKISHGLFNYYLSYGIGYRYHRLYKGFYLRKKRWL